MLSLSNAFNEEDLLNFEKKILNFINEKIYLEYSVEPKIDGISASLTYKNGVLGIPLLVIFSLKRSVLYLNFQVLTL